MKQRAYIEVGAIKKIPSILSSLKAKKIFLVTGKNSYTACGAQKILEPMLKGRSVVHFTDFSSNPDIKDILKGIRSADADVDLFIAVGGGSAIDVAKTVNVLSAQEGDPMKYAIGERELQKSAKPLIAVPTTTGSGSEATDISVFYKNKTKYSLSHKFLLPSYAIVDPSLTMSMSHEVAASTSMDAFSQAVESFWSVHATQESQRYAEEAIRLIIPSIRDSVNKSDKDARFKMAKAAHLSGKSINIAKTTVCHALSYAMTMHLGIPHGHACALTLPKALEYNAQVTADDCADKRGVVYVRKNMHNLLAIFNSPSISEAQQLIKNMMNDLALESSPRKLGIQGLVLDRIISQANLERLQNNPRRFTDQKALKILFE